MAFSAYESGEYRQAYKGFKSLAQEHHVKSQYLLGLLYINGQGVRKSVDRGIGWLKEAADNGSYRAAAELGQIYATGRDVAMNAEEAAKWIQRSTDLAEDEDADEECD
ncbi:MAG: sel1 repeat family protein [Gammaproteobacteria bacterium]|nr:sel1 repeat family protein [Gammaproteobacteria bacterium]